MISAGGCTCKTPAFTVHGPNPSTSPRSRTAIVKSWCHTTFQFELRVLLKRIPLTAKHRGPRTTSMISRTGLDIASSRTLGMDKRFSAGAEYRQIVCRVVPAQPRLDRRGRLRNHSVPQAASIHWLFLRRSDSSSPNSMEKHYARCRRGRFRGGRGRGGCRGLRLRCGWRRRVCRGWRLRGIWRCGRRSGGVRRFPCWPGRQSAFAELRARGG